MTTLPTMPELEQAGADAYDLLEAHEIELFSRYWAATDTASRQSLEKEIHCLDKRWGEFDCNRTPNKLVDRAREFKGYR